jgi:redox-sensing transcriptional repressor
VKVFSNNLGDAIGVTPAVVRKDFSTISIPGNKRGGYNIDVIIEEIERVLGKEERQQVVIIGCGKIGQALMSYSEFEKEGIEVVVGFDLNPDVVDPSNRIPIYPLEEFQAYVSHRDIKVAVLAVPDSAATEVFEMVTQAGIPGVLNFTAVELKCTKCDFDNCPVRCVVQNVNIGLEIENLFYLVRMKNADMLEEAGRSAESTVKTQAG